MPEHRRRRRLAVARRRSPAPAPAPAAPAPSRAGATRAGALRLQAIALLGIVERNAYLVRRYGWWKLAFFVWTIANTLTITFIADGVRAGGGQLDVTRQTMILLIGAVIWS